MRGSRIEIYATNLARIYLLLLVQNIVSSCITDEVVSDGNTSDYYCGRGSFLVRDTDYSDLGFRGFPQSPRRILWKKYDLMKAI
jgi:hypothetical protein